MTTGTASPYEASPPGLAMCRVPGRDDCTFLLLRDGLVAGSTRATTTLPARRSVLPAMRVFSREINAALGSDATIVEASLTVINDASGLEPRLALVHLLKGPMVECALQHADWFLVAVEEDEIGFYRRMLNMEILSGAEPYPGTAISRVLMGLNCREHAQLVYKRIPVLAVTASDISEYAQSGMVRFNDDVSRHHAA